MFKIEKQSELTPPNHIQTDSKIDKTISVLAYSAYLANIIGVVALTYFAAGVDENREQKAVVAKKTIFSEAALPEPSEYTHQHVRTYFINITDSDGSFIKWRPVDEPAYNEFVEGEFAPNEKYKYNFIVDGGISRKENKLISFTSDKNIIEEGRAGQHQTYHIDIPQYARITPLSALSAKERDTFYNIYIAHRDRLGTTNVAKHNQSMPAGLVDPNIYSDQDVNGYSMQTWVDQYNRGGFSRYFMDIGGVYDGLTLISGKKITTDIILENEGKYCRHEVKSSADKMDQYGYPVPINLSDARCKLFNEMSTQEILSLKKRAAALGIQLHDKTIYTYIRNSDEEIIATNEMNTLSPRHRQQDDIQMEHHYFVDLNANQSRVSRVVEAVTQHNNNLNIKNHRPTLVNTGKKRDYTGAIVDTFTVAGKQAYIDTNPSSVKLKVIDGRFVGMRQHSNIPTSQKNQFGF